jgi:GTP-binding protein
MQDISKIRNVAIVAHVDHGKTTLVDQLLIQSGTFRENQSVAERVMDSGDLEKEKGITITSKNCTITWGDYLVNLVDTPGHADFGGEVERVMKTIDAVLLVVDSFDGPQAQTKFVLRKALNAGAKPIVVINKIDRPSARPHAVLDMVFELFLELDATDEQLDFPVVYASGKEGFSAKEWAGSVTEQMKTDGMKPLFETIVEKCPAPAASLDADFQMIVANLQYDEYVGRLGWGKIYGGKIKIGDPLISIHEDGSKTKGKVTKILANRGLEKVEVQEIEAGRICGIAGIEDVFIGETLVGNDTTPALPFIAIDPPTLNMQILVNDSPLAGREGKLLTARQIGDRLKRETRGNVSIQVEELDTPGAFKINARGEMQVAILVEQMRREGFEMSVSRPEVIFHTDESGNRLEPIENLYIEVYNDHLGGVLQNIANRKAEIINMEHRTATVYVEAVISTRGLIGLETDLKNLTKGTGIMGHMFKEYGSFRGEIPGRNNGVLIAMENGTTTAYALDALQDRSTLFVAPSEEVYGGMIVGENARPDDMVVNPCKAKALSNMRSTGDGKGIQLTPAIKMSLERSIEYIGADEYLEVTPQSLRLRKKILDHNLRKRSEQSKNVMA